MNEKQEQIKQLQHRLTLLTQRQEMFSKEINELRKSIWLLAEKDDEKTAPEAPLPTPEPVAKPVHVWKSEPAAHIPRPQQPAHFSASPDKIKSPKAQSNLEKFIGENLINKIGIAITIIGVSIGAKYAIDNQLISPLTRIILGYLVGAGLLGFAIKLKKNYDNFSAVLLSGSMAIMYFITFAAYSFYELFPQVVAFALMVVFTAFTVLSAIKYNKQVIAHIGLVGAYAVPFLLSDGSGRVAVLFTYMAIINVGILVLSIKKYWKPLYYSSFGLTWLIYVAWYGTSYQTIQHYELALIFLTVFFAIFYLTFLSYKLVQKEKFLSDDILLLLLNSFIFYGLGYTILSSHQTGEHFLGLFTLANAIVHFIVGAAIYSRKLADRNLFYLVTGLVLVFLTIAAPVQLDGNWVTLLWAGEAALLFWVGRTKNAPFYEKMAYPLMALAFFSIVHDWTTVYSMYYSASGEQGITPLLNIHFLTSLLFIGFFGFIYYLDKNKATPSLIATEKEFWRGVSYIIPVILLITLYYAFRLEIANFWNQLYAGSAIAINTQESYPDTYWNYDLLKFKAIWIINYTMLFLAALSFLNLKKLRNKELGYVNLALNVLAIAAFLMQGLYLISELRESYLQQSLAEYYSAGFWHIGIRYVSLAFVALLLFACYKYVRQEFNQREYKIGFDFLLHTTILWVASSEMIHWLDMAASAQTYKFGLSVLWGTYSLLLIALGIWKQKKYLRIAAIVLFGVTLVKLFAYDISNLNTIAKTISFVSLGILLLIISFLYNKYKHLISGEVEK